MKAFYRINYPVFYGKTRNRAAQTGSWISTTIIFLAFFALSSGRLSGQPWMESLPQDRLSNGEVTFYEIQQAFEDYWAPFNVRDGYYEVNGERVKAGGWKQFKRWEWFWQSRVDPITGEFPKTSAYAEWQKYRQADPGGQGSRGAGGGYWTGMGPSSTGGGYAGLGRLNCVAFHPTSSSTLYVGAASGGVWKSTNGGSSWIPLCDENAVLGVSDIIVLPNGSTEIIYIGTGDRDASDNYSVGVLKSTDGGLTWNTTGLNWTQSQGRLVNRLLVDPSSSSTLYAATSSGFYKTTDAGATWIQKTTTQFVDVAFKPGNNQVIYGSTRSGGYVYRSTDAGNTWSQVYSTGGTRVALAVSAGAPEVVYALATSGSALKGIYKSADGGSTFTQTYGSTPNLLGWNCNAGDTGGQGWYDLCMAADPVNANIVFVGGVNTWKSADGGTTWSISNHWSSNCTGSTTVVHADKHFFAYQPGTTTLFECNDGGLYKTANAGASWTHLGSGLVISQMYRLGVAQTAANEVITGLQDNGTKAILSGTWSDEIGGDGMECLIDYTNHNILYGELYYGDIRRSTNHGGGWTSITGSIPGDGGWVTPYVIDPNDHLTLYVGYADVWKTTNQGSSWTQISSFGSGSTLSSLAVAPSNSSYLYASRSNIIYKTTNGGTTWTNITGTLPVSSSGITYISVKNDDPNTIWVSLGSFNAYKVYQSTDGGATWTNISAGLPSLPANCVIQNKLVTSQVELYCGTDVGVFMKQGDAAWVPYYNNLPNVVVTELDIYYAADPASSRIRAATYGRGLWESAFMSPDNNPPAFTSDPIAESNATEDSPYSGSIADNATDPDSDPLTFSRISGPAWLTVSASGSLSGTPLNANVGLNTWTVQVSDGNGGTDQAQLQVTVINTNDPPVFTSDPIVEPDAKTGLTYSGSIADNATDEDGNTLSFSKISGPSWLTVSANGVLSGIPSSGDLGLNTWTVQVSDGTATDQAQLQITVSIPAYCPSAGASTANEWIQQVTLAGMTNASGNNGGYRDYTGITFNLQSGTAANIVLTPGFPGRSRFEYWAVYIDYNNDYDFDDAGEQVFSAVRLKTPVSGTFTTQNVTAVTRMRISMSFAGIPGPCEAISQGEVEDYTVAISPPVLAADFTASSTSITAGESVTFTDLTTLNPTSWSWTFEGGSPASSTTQNPVVTYPVAGTFDVTLTASNESQYDTETKLNYITVTDPPTSYCPSSGANYSQEWIGGVSIGGLNNPSGASGYSDFTSLDPPDLQKGSTYPVSLTPAFSNKSRFEYWRVWIDYNTDFDFADPGEEVFAANNTKTTASGQVTIPADVGTGLTRMRVSMKNAAAPAPCENFARGEVEDYTVNIVPPGPVSGPEDPESARQEPDIALFPNPATGKVTLLLSGWQADVVVKVYDITGAMALQLHTRDGSRDINISGLNPGIYLFMASDGKALKAEKLAVE